MTKSLVLTRSAVARSHLLARLLTDVQRDALRSTPRLMLNASLGQDRCYARGVPTTDSNTLSDAEFMRHFTYEEDSTTKTSIRAVNHRSQSRQRGE